MTTLFKNLRPLLLSVLIFALVAGGTPVTLETFAKWGRPAAARRKKTKRYRRHSRAWWRRHRALQRARRERAERRRLERAARLAAQQGAPASEDLTVTAGGSARRPVNQSGGGASAVSAPRLPFDAQVPHTWAGARKGANGEVTFAVNTPDGRASGTAILMPFGAARPEGAGAAPSARSKKVGGTPVAELRRTVIDKMVAQGGWVVNDMVREMGGRRVFIVQAQTGTPGAPTKSLTFYFAEVDGRLYTLATTTPVEFADPVAAGSEQFMATLRAASARSLASQQQ